MYLWLRLLLSLIMFSACLAVQIDAQASADTAVYAVSYVEVVPSARVAMYRAMVSGRAGSAARWLYLQKSAKSAHATR